MTHTYIELSLDQCAWIVVGSLILSMVSFLAGRKSSPCIGCRRMAREEHPEVFGREQNLN